MVKRSKPKKDPDIILEYDFSQEEKKKDVPCPKVSIEEEKEVKKGKKEDIKEVKSSERLESELSRSEERLGRKKKTKKRVEKEKKIKKEIEAPVDDVIQALLDSEKTFVENITRNAKKSPFSAFYPFPKNISFMSIGKDEAVVLIVRHHWSKLVSRGVLALLALFFPFLISYSVPTWFEGAIGSAFFIIGLFLFFMMISATILIDSFLKWFFQMNVITTKRIIDVDFVSITTHRVSETTFDQVQDVSHSPAGPFASFFDYGDLYVQTAGSQREFEFHNIPRPRDVQDTILDLRELRKKKFAGIK